MKVIWSERALQALEDIREHRLLRSERGAERLIDELTRRGDALGDMPTMGRVVPDLNVEQIRERIVSGYRMIYRIGPDGVEILTVRHGSIPID